MRQNNKKGFTLIELLVVITIIGILAVGGVSVYTSQIAKAKDSNRVKDIMALDSGINQFYQDNNAYPNKFTGKDKSNHDFVFIKETYLQREVTDVETKNACLNSQCAYSYVYGTRAGIEKAGYEVSTAFENAGTVASKANNKKDGGNDEDRFEISNGLADFYKSDVQPKGNSPKGVLKSPTVAKNQKNDQQMGGLGEIVYGS